LMPSGRCRSWYCPVATWQPDTPFRLPWVWLRAFTNVHRISMVCHILPSNAPKTEGEERLGCRLPKSKHRVGNRQPEVPCGAG